MTNQYMDELSQYNKERWEELAQAKVAYSLPLLDLTPEVARQRLDPRGLLDNVRGRDVLCLAASGGQQSAMFGLLCANVTVFDLSDTQLQRDRETAEHYGYAIRTQQGDMRDLSCFADDAFDLVYHAYSINFVPTTAPVFREVARVLRPGGLYQMTCANPFTMSVDSEAWDGTTYLLHHPYIDGFEISTLYPHWDVADDHGGWQQIRSPREFRHTLSTLLNGLAANGFVLRHMEEEVNEDPDPEPGTWEYFKSIAAPYLTFWAVYRPDVLTGQ